MARPIITGVELTEYTYTLQDFGKDYNGFNLVYQAGGSVTGKATVLQVHTDAGITGEYVTGAAQIATLPMFVDYLLGRSALERERIYQDVKRALRQQARVGLASVDVALGGHCGQIL